MESKEMGNSSTVNLEVEVAGEEGVPDECTMTRTFRGNQDLLRQQIMLASNSELEEDIKTHTSEYELKETDTIGGKYQSNQDLLRQQTMLASNSELEEDSKTHTSQYDSKEMDMLDTSSRRTVRLKEDDDDKEIGPAEYTLEGTNQCDQAIGEQQTTSGVAKLNQSELEEDKKTLFCEPCMFDDTQELAVGFCVTCVEYLCQNCCREHKKSKVTRSHNIIKDNIPKDPSTFRLLKEMTSCSEHPDMQVTHRCADHGVHVCVLCIAGNHRKCDHVTELARNESCDTRAKETAEKLAELLVKSQSIIHMREQNIVTMLEEKRMVEEDNSALVKRIQETLSLLEKTVIQKADKMTNSKIKNLRKDIEQCSFTNSESNAYSQLLLIATQHGTTTDIDIITTKMQQKISELETRLEQLKLKGQAHLKFTRNPLLEQIRSLGNLKLISDKNKTEKQEKQVLESGPNMDVSSDGIMETAVEIMADRLGDRDINKNDSSDSGQNQAGATQHKQKTKRKSRGKNVVNKNPMKKVSVRFSGDTSACSVIQIAILSGGKIVLVDQTNRKIKVFSADYKHVCVQVLEDEPNDMCQTGPDSFVIVFKSLKQIDVFKFADKNITKVKIWKTKNQNFRITTKDEHLVVLCKTDSDNLSSLLLQFRRQQDAKVMIEVRLSEMTQEIFEDVNCSLTSSAEGIIVFINPARVICLVGRNNMEGLDIKWMLNLESKVRDVRGITTDLANNIIICSTTSSSVYKILATDRTQVLAVLSEIRNPLSVKVNGKKDQLLIGCSDNYLHVVNVKS